MRRLLTGTWTTLANPIPSSDSASNAILLSDGTVMVHGGGNGTSNAWYKLTPVDGNYVDGTWTTLPPMSVYRTVFPSVVLQNGDVFVFGGEYTGPGDHAQTENNTGEIFNPLGTTSGYPAGTGSWSSTLSFPQTDGGDAPMEMLANGDVLVGNIIGTQVYAYNPSNNTWTQTGSKLNGDKSQEEAWVKTPNDDILAYAVTASISTGTPQAQEYVPSTGAWQAAGNPPAALSSGSVGYELGPGMMLPNGDVFYAGGTNATAYYDPGTNTWTAGPNMPNGYCMADAPGAVLPNGNLLLSMSPEGELVGGSYNFPTPVKVYELNTSTNTYTNVTPSLSNFNVNTESEWTTFLSLPSGQVLMTNQSQTVAVYTPSGSAQASWAPEITNITNNAGSNTFTLSGYQLNGISEGSYYGDDWGMSSNYPIVQLTDQYGDITYARTFNWTLDGVASVDSSCSFTEPSTGAYIVNVIANGIASAPVLDLQCSSSNGENFAVQPDSNISADVQVNLGENGSFSSQFALTSFAALIMTGDAANNTLVINDNLGGRETTINGGNGTNTLDVENNGSGYVTEYGGNGTDNYDFSLYNDNLSNIANYTYVQGSTGNEQVYLYDHGYTTGTTYSVTSGSVSRSGFAGMFYAVPVDGISLTTGTGADTVNVTSTYTGTPVTLYGEAAETVNIGSSGSVQYIDAAVTVVNAPSFTNLIIDDSSDSTARGFIVISNTSTGSITGLAPVPIYWTPDDISGITIKGGTGGNDFYVSNADIAPYTTTIDAGTGSNGVYFENVVAGSFSVSGQGNTVVGVYDDDETSNQSWSLTSTSVSRSGFSAGYSSITSLALDTGYGNDTVDIESDPCPTTISNYGGEDTYDVTTGSHDLAYLPFALTVSSGGGGAALVLDNVSYSNNTYTTITSNQFDFEGIIVNYSDISTLTYDVANPSSVVYITSTIDNVAYVINGGTDGTTLDLGEGNLTNVTSFILFDEGGITFNGVNGSGSELLLDDSASSTPLNYVFSNGAVTLTGQLAVTYTYLNSIVLDAGTGADTDTVSGTGTQGALTINESSGNDTALVTGTSLLGPLVINAGSGIDTFTVGTTGGSLLNLTALVTINGQTGIDSLIINNQVNYNFTFTSNSIISASSTIESYEVDYSAMTSITANLGAASGAAYTVNVNSTASKTPVTLNMNSSTATININSTSYLAPVIIFTAGGNDPVNVGTMGDGGAIAEFTSSQQIGVLTMNTGGTAIVTTGTEKVLQVTTVVDSGTGTLDLTTNDLVVHSSTLATVSALVKSGFNNGTWTGAGITSSSAAGDANHLTALGTILNTYDGTHPIFSSSNLFDGYAPSITDILVKHTYYGDANLDGKDDGSDYSLTDNGYLHHLSGWYNGDFNYDGTVNGTDYTLIDNTHNRQGAGLAASIAPAKSAAVVAVPTSTTPPEKDKKAKAARHPLLET